MVAHDRMQPWAATASELVYPHAPVLCGDHVGICVPQLPSVNSKFNDAHIVHHAIMPQGCNVPLQ